MQQRTLPIAGLLVMATFLSCRDYSAGSAAAEIRYRVFQLPAAAVDSVIPQGRRDAIDGSTYQLALIEGVPEMIKPVVITLVSVLLCTGCAVMHVAEPKAKVSGDWYVSERDRKIDLPELAYTHGNYMAAIIRKYDGDHELKLLRIAEAVYPNRKAVDEWRQQVQSPESAQSAAGLPDWSYLTVNGVFVPCAITSAAVQYYSKLVEACENGDISATGGVAVQRCRLRYSAIIDHHKWFDFQGRRYPECYVVRMELLWAEECGQDCGMAFVKQRLVVLSPDGDVLGVHLDGPTTVGKEEAPATEETPATQGAPQSNQPGTGQP